MTIEIQALEPADYILTHIKDLEVTQTGLTDLATDQEVRVARSFEYTRNEYWVVVPEAKLRPGNYSLHLQFNGDLTKGITGFYRSVYTNAQGEKVPIATSKFQPTHARKAFPCFDEPSFKSTFSTKLVRPSEKYIALSNMPEEGAEADKPNPGLTVVTFKRSVPMVTYLACFIVCDFQYQVRKRVLCLFRAG